MSWSKHKKILAMAKGYRGRANSCYRTAINRVEKGLQYQYRDRKQKKRVRLHLSRAASMAPDAVWPLSLSRTCARSGSRRSTLALARRA